jgi:NADPH:quinone reductase-like Zn-dependent oxidoreductase
MKAYRIDRFGSIDGIVLRSSEDPQPGTKEILLRVRASSLNYRDLMVLKGGGRGPTKLGVIPLSDGAGEVAAIGAGVTRVKIGDRVAGCFHPRWFGGPITPDYLTDRVGANLDGMLAEYAVLSEEALVRVPTHLSFEEAATLPCAAVTAWVALTGQRRVTAGDTVLTQGSGGVSVFALQFARLLGARVIATTSTPQKAERLKALGASEVINYTETPNWDDKARELTDGRGVDCVVEIGGPGTIAMSLKALAVGGHVSLIGASLSLSGTGLDPLLLTGRGITLGSISVGSRADFEAMNRAITMHRLGPVIDRTFPFAEAKTAYRHFEGRSHFGKVVITHG